MDTLIGDDKSVQAHVKAQDEIAEYIFGMVARRDGNPMDKTKSIAWQTGWAGSGMNPHPDAAKAAPLP